ncbi:MAG: glycosyltransferase family 1 protein [Moorea sp. SIO4A3]|nr:glycosyltransferase family 1 protein [Moorena sp. SIO4A3]
MLIIQIVPQLPPAINGLGDYAFNLAQQLRKDFGIETHFIVCDPTWTGATQIEGFPVSQVNVHSADTLVSLLPRDPTATVLLHYVGYGYAKRGCPVWLVDGLQRWRNASINRTLVTMFHELYAFGLPWASSFWLSPLQINLAARLARMSERCLTSLQGYAKILYKFSRGKHTDIPTLPVFSNIGEPAQIPPLAERHRRLVVFGGRGNRRRVYQQSLAKLDRTSQLLGIEEIWDIGLPTGLTLSTVNGVPVVEMGKCSDREISSILLNSLAGFFNYDTNRLAKSGVFAAYCAHGVLSVSSRSSTLICDGIKPRKHYWIPDYQTTSLKNLGELQGIADNAYNWYQTHNLSVQAEVFSENLF